MNSVELHSKNPNKRDLGILVKALENGDTFIFPTDTVMAVGCLVSNNQGIDDILATTNKKDKKAKLSLLCKDIKQAAQYLLPMPNHIFRTMKDYVPGPYTFILKADSKAVKNLGNKKNEIGIRIPDNEILKEIIELAGVPIICTSLSNDGKFYKNYEEIIEDYKNKINHIIITDWVEQEESTVFDCTEDDLVLVREGKGKVD
ncbi:MAG TPA: L-threonylcarbamoyladenylate synthase [Saprospiraceae bacterium]|nr:threonylcarbamoyl-AMP synthase [Lewinellaceae bacterium]HPQ21519.1 L-threonylcarbamoyladenylate synthase [Saprospiraceae bacterium]